MFFISIHFMIIHFIQLTGQTVSLSVTMWKLEMQLWSILASLLSRWVTPQSLATPHDDRAHGSDPQTHPGHDQKPQGLPASGAGRQSVPQTLPSWNWWWLQAGSHGPAHHSHYQDSHEASWTELLPGKDVLDKFYTFAVIA